MINAGQTSTLVVRLRPELAAQHPSIPAHTWYPVLPYNPVALNTQPERGLIWVTVEGRLRKLPTCYFEFNHTASQC